MKIAHSIRSAFIAVSLCWLCAACCQEKTSPSAPPPPPAKTNTPPTAPLSPEEAARAHLHLLRTKLLDANVSNAEREEAGIELAATREGGDILLSLASQEKISAALMPALSEAIFRNPDFSVRALASKHFQRPSRSGAAFPSLRELTQMKGNPIRGREIYFGATSACSKCHAYGGQGGDFGPDLTHVQAKLPRDTIFDAVLNPSATIMFGYEAWLIETKEGESYTGLIVSDDEKTVVLKTGSGQTVSIPSGNITLRQPQTLSLMPDNITIGLSAQDLVDMVDFLTAPQ